MTDIVNNIFSINQEAFPVCALAIFRYQYQHNAVYRRWVDALGIKPVDVRTMEKIPFMPVSFFKEHQVYAGAETPEMVFESSGTTGSVNSRHYVKSPAVYIESCIRGFELFYGDLSGWCILALLPSYLERNGSSLVLMVQEFMKRSGHRHSGFFLNDHSALAGKLAALEQAGQPTLLIGVTFGLLDFAETYRLELKHTIVMETGGMKGRRKEIIRPEVHAVLQKSLGVADIHSEYGMTEMLSQAYSGGKGVFSPVPWLKLLVRNEEDPFDVAATGSGILNVIDLANLHSCSFLATDDLGKVREDGRFEVFGRVDHSDIRGCSLLYQ